MFKIGANHFVCFVFKLKLKSASFTYLPDPTEESRKGFIEQNKTDLVRLDKHAAGRKFLVGEHVTIADLYFYEVWTGLKCISEVAVSDLKNLANLYALFENQEWFKNYRASDKWLERGIFPPSAKFNNLAINQSS